jgi:hypothetical protein
VRRHNPAVTQLDLCEPAPHIVAGFVTLFRNRQADDFHSCAAIELNEKIREKGQSGA